MERHFLDNCGSKFECVRSIDKRAVRFVIGMLNDLRLHQTAIDTHSSNDPEFDIMNATYSALGLPVATRAITMKGPGLLLEFRVAMLTQNISYSFFTLLIWDMLLTLKDEVRQPY